MVKIIHGSPGMGLVLKRDELNEFLSRKINIQIATIDEKGYPNIQPTWFYYDDNEEIENNGFDLAKISAELCKFPNYVLCLFYQNDSRKDELAEKYQGKNGIEYRYWKSYEDTLKGKYSKQYSSYQK